MRGHAKRWIGRWLMGVGVIHTVAGFLLFGAPLRAIAAAGFWHALDIRDPINSLPFWFLLSGFLTMIVGYLADWSEGIGKYPLPRTLGWALLAITVIGAIILPVSGFWLLFPPALGTLAQSRLPTE